ncbi:MAG: hypothetical protein K8T89_18970 [Planctomycetes bacterium]|nr:hypothetical protein [Planctomycetota bacterium]
MAKRKKGGINKSAAIRDVYMQNPELKVKEVVKILAEKGIKTSENLVYMVKGKIKGEKPRRRDVDSTIVKVSTPSGSGDAVRTIIKVKDLAIEVGGMKTLKALVDALSA